MASIKEYFIFYSFPVVSVCWLHIDDLGLQIFLFLTIVFYIHAAAYVFTGHVISSFLIETEEYPCQFVLAYSLSESLGPQIVESPVVGNLHDRSIHFRMSFLEYREHFGERVREEEP